MEQMGMEAGGGQSDQDRKEGKGVIRSRMAKVQKNTCWPTAKLIGAELRSRGQMRTEHGEEEDVGEVRKR